MNSGHVSITGTYTGKSWEKLASLLAGEQGKKRAAQNNFAHIYVKRKSLENEAAILNYFWSINSVKFHKSHITRKLQILGRGLSGPMKTILSSSGWQSDGSGSFAKKQSYLATTRVHLSHGSVHARKSFFLSWCTGHCQRWTHRLHWC